MIDAEERETLKSIREAWRRAHPRIVAAWKRIDQMTEVEKRQRMTDAAFLREIATIAKDIPSYFGIEQEDVHRLNDIAQAIEKGVVRVASLKEYTVESIKRIQDLQGIVGGQLPAVHISAIPEETKRLNDELLKNWDAGVAVGKSLRKK